VRLSAGQGSLFDVIDMQTGETINSNPLARDIANAQAASLQRAADATAAEALAAEFVRSREPAPAPAPRPVAADGHHVHAAADGTWAVHGPGCVMADAVRIVAMKETRPRSSRPRGRPRKAAPARSPEALPPMAAAGGLTK
jgi:hypothetical protein